MINKKLLTIITPTFNRANTLTRLYESLLIQKSEFVWMIVDDGSSDNTEDIVSSFINDRKIDIVYLKKINGGKHTALNYGIKLVATELIMIVDSDDILLPNAVQTIEEYYKKYSNNNKISTFTFLKCYSNGTNVVPIEKDEFIENYIKYRIKENRPGDMAEVFRADVLKQYPFPEFYGEKFLSEDVVWIEIGKKFDSVYINIPVYQCEYLDSGLSANDKKMKFASPIGSMLRGKQLMSRECGLKANLKGAIIYSCYSKAVNKNDEIPITFRERFLCFLTSPFAMYFFRKWSCYL